MGKGLSRKEVENTINQIVFGVDYKTDKRGEPIEQGKGSAAQPTQREPPSCFSDFRRSRPRAYRTAQRER
jgi:hypothetical protein